MKNFYDAAVSDCGSGKVFCYRSSMLVMEEGLFNGVPVSYGYNASGYPLNVLTNCQTRLDCRKYDEPFCFNVEIDGETVCRRMTCDGFETEEKDGHLHAVAVFESGVKPVKIYEHTILDGTDMLTRYLEIENLSDRAVNISRLAVHGGGIEETDLDSHIWDSEASPLDIYEYGCFDNDCWGREGEFAFHKLTPGRTTVQTRFGRARFRHPALFVFNRLTGITYYMQIAWNGGSEFNLDFDAKSGITVNRLSYSAEITGYNALYKLAPGEKFTTPEVHFCAVHGGLDEAVNAGIAHIRKSVFNKPETDEKEMFIGAGMGPEHDMSFETSMCFAKQFSDMGAETFIVDAGWYTPPGEENRWFAHNGCNIPDKDRYPDNGLARLRDYCHSLGLKFALWMEPERLGDDFAAEHPGFFAENLYGEEVRSLIDMTNPVAAAWVESEIERVITEYKIDLLRIDFNIDGKEIFRFRGSECLAVRHYNAVNAMYARLKAKHPDIVFENCAGGGGRTDLATVRNFSHTWVSDNQIMPRSIEITNGMTMVLPPEKVDRLFAGMGCHQTGELAAHVRNTMLTHMTANVVAPAALTADDESMEFIRHSLELYKEKIRPVIPECLVYHHTPDRKTAYRKGYRALEIASPDKHISVSAIFTLAPGGKTDFAFTPKGINAGKKYRVYTDNDRTAYETTGAEIKIHGIPVHTAGSALSSELIIAEEI